MNFTGNVVNPNGTIPLIPQQQMVIPPVTIPQGFTAKPQYASVKQFTCKGAEAAKKVPIGPNSRVAIFDENEGSNLFYFRETDENGADVGFGTYRYEEVLPPPEPEYLTKDEFYKALDNFAKSLKEDLVNGKSVCTEE